MLESAHSAGLFEVSCRKGKVLKNHELMWSNEYLEEGSYKFWSLGFPKKNFKELVHALDVPSQGLTVAILGCGLGVEVDYLARQFYGDGASLSGKCAVAGIDFAATAIDQAKRDFGNTPGAFFYHADVTELQPPMAPLDLVIDNTVFQNVRSNEGDRGEVSYLKALSRISTPGHTVLYLNLMSKEGVKRRPEFAECMKELELPLIKKKQIVQAFSSDWTVHSITEGLYDLRPEGAGLECPAFYTYGGAATPGIPSWSVLLLRKEV